MSNRLKARVLKGSTITVVTAFGGHEYIQSEWRNVPEGMEESARKNPYLEVQELNKVEQIAGKIVEAAGVQPNPRQTKNDKKNKPGATPEPSNAPVESKDNEATQ